MARIRATRIAAVTLAAMACCVGTAQAADNGNPERLRDAQAQYRAERQACLDGRTGQDRESCLYEAASVLAEARSGKQETSESPDVLMRNALARCAAVLPDDRPACERMARGEGEQSGSVAAGGVLKQIVTRTVGPAPQPMPTPQPTNSTTPPMTPAPR